MLKYDSVISAVERPDSDIVSLKFILFYKCNSTFSPMFVCANRRL